MIEVSVPKLAETVGSGSDGTGVQRRGRDRGYRDHKAEGCPAAHKRVWLASSSRTNQNGTVPRTTLRCRMRRYRPIS
jgi:hypothetical protein